MYCGASCAPSSCACCDGLSDQGSHFRVTRRFPRVCCAVLARCSTDNLYNLHRIVQAFARQTRGLAAVQGRTAVSKWLTAGDPYGNVHMARTKQTAPKSTGGPRPRQKKPRHAVPLHCAYHVAPTAAASSSSDSESESSGSEADDLGFLVATSLAAACEAAGISPLQQVDLDTDAATIPLLAALHLSDRA
jgi:hypothetical protein